MARLDPALTASEFNTAPTPVCSPHPSGASDSSGSDFETFPRLRQVASAWVAKEDWPKK
jgi:hypothetical protein